jgi:hypothetical protein
VLCYFLDCQIFSPQFLNFNVILGAVLFEGVFFSSEAGDNFELHLVPAFELAFVLDLLIVNQLVLMLQGLQSLPNLPVFALILPQLEILSFQLRNQQILLLALILICVRLL